MSTKTMESDTKDLVFKTDDQERLRIKANGDILVNGKKAANDQAVYEGLKMWVDGALPSKTDEQLAQEDAAAKAEEEGN